MSTFVLDTNVFGADLRPGGSELADRYAELVAGNNVVISFVTLAELEFGAARAGWGPKRVEALDALVRGVRVVWPGAALVRSYVTLRTACADVDHGLGDRTHEADRWIGATAAFLSIPLVTHDRVFIGAPGLDVVTLAA